MEGVTCVDWTTSTSTHFVADNNIENRLEEIARAVVAEFVAGIDLPLSGNRENRL